MSEPGGVKDFACRGVGLKVTLYNGAALGAVEGSARPRAPGFYWLIRMMGVAKVRRVLSTLP